MSNIASASALTINKIEELDSQTDSRNRDDGLGDTAMTLEHALIQSPVAPALVTLQGCHLAIYLAKFRRFGFLLKELAMENMLLKLKI